MSQVSVIIPCYNQESFIAEAVASVQAQTHKNIQIIVIDDGSTDDSWNVIQSLGVSAIHQENLGVCLASQHAFEVVTGEFVMRLDGDDYLPADYIASQLAVLERSKAAYAYSDAEYFGSRTGRMKSGPFSWRRLVQENYIHVSALVRAEVIRECGYFHESMTTGFDDWDLWLRLYEKGYTGVYNPKTHIFYRQREEAGRNDMAREQNRAMRAQIQVNHPDLYRRPDVKLLVLAWKVRRRIHSWGKK